MWRTISTASPTRLDRLHRRFETHIGAAVDRVAQLSVPRRRSGSSRRRKRCPHVARNDADDTRCRPHRGHYAALRRSVAASIRAIACWRRRPSFSPTPGAPGCIRKPPPWNTACASRTTARRARSPMNGMTEDPTRRRPAVNVGARARERPVCRARACRAGRRRAAGNAVPLRPVARQAVLRRQPSRGPIHGHRRTCHAGFGAARPSAVDR